MKGRQKRRDNKIDTTDGQKIRSDCIRQQRQDQRLPAGGGTLSADGGGTGTVGLSPFFDGSFSSGRDTWEKEDARISTRKSTRSVKI